MDYSMSSVDTDPTSAQYDDSGSSADFSSLLSTAANIGSEISMVASGINNSPLTAQAVPTYIIPRPAAPTASSSNAMLILIIVLVLGVGYALMGGSRS
jgi:hypothetical protein